MSLIEHVLNNSHQYLKKSKSTNCVNHEQAVAPRSYSGDDISMHLSNKIGLNDFFLSSVSLDSNYSAAATIPSNEQSWLELFNDRLETLPGHSNIYKITAVDALSDLLDYYYSIETNKLTVDMFPYLHGLNNVKQRIFFNEDVDLIYLDSLSLNDSKVKKFSKPIELPKSTHFNLMIINAIENSSNNLLNSINLHDVLIPKSINFKSTNIIEKATSNYEYFNYVNRTSYNFNERLNNRNYAIQAKLLAPLSHFLIYNTDNNFQLNLDTAVLINQLSDNNKSIYIVDIDWDLIDKRYIETDDKTYPVQQIRNKPFSCKLLKWEQNLIWKLNSMKWCFKNCCLGNIIDFSNLLKESSIKHSFKLFVNCHEYASFPSLDSIKNIFRDLKNNSLKDHYSIEFPTSGSINLLTLTDEEVLSFLYCLKLIYSLTERFNEKVFIFSFDGFSGLSLLVLAYGILLTEDSVEHVILRLLGDPPLNSPIPSNNLRLYFFKSDLLLLKKFENLISYIKNINSSDEFELIGSLCYEEFNKYHNKILRDSTSHLKYDWFNLSKDNNFPSKIYHNLYLGSVDHASSFTLLKSINIDKIISIGEKPNWFNQLKVSFDFELHPKYNVINPIFTFNDGSSKIYEITLSGKRILKGYPNLKSIIYIYNLKDDGKDSILPLLIDCPEQIQSKFLINPNLRNLKTLIHCRIGVSRSASLVIASAMKFHKMNLLNAYLFTRVKRFIIIIQPNLKIFYELYLYEEFLKIKRTYSWWVICKEIHKLNNHYIEG